MIYYETQWDANPRLHNHTWNVHRRVIGVDIVVLGMHWRTLSGRMSGAIILAIIVHGMRRRSALAGFRISRVPCSRPLLQYLHFPHLLLPDLVVIILLHQNGIYSAIKPIIGLHPVIKTVLHLRLRTYLYRVSHSGCPFQYFVFF